MTDPNQKVHKPITKNGSSTTTAGENIATTPEVTYLVAPTWQLSVAMKAQNTNSATAARFSSNPNLPESVVGEIAEKIVARIAEMLVADNVFICSPDSVLNHELKTDLVICKGHVCWPYQVKNSAKGGQEFLTKNGNGVVLNGQHYDRPGLIVVPKTYKERRQLLKRLATEHGLDIAPHVLKARDLRKKFMENAVDKLSIRETRKFFPAGGLEALEILGLAQRQQDKWLFVQRA